VEKIREIGRNDNTEWSSEENINQNYYNYFELHGLFRSLERLYFISFTFTVTLNFKPWSSRLPSQLPSGGKVSYISRLRDHTHKLTDRKLKKIDFL